MSQVKSTDDLLHFLPLAQLFSRGYHFLFMFTFLNTGLRH